MDRATVYTQEQGRSVDFLFAQRATMIGLAKLSQAAFGSGNVVRGLAVTPNSPAALNVLVGIGEIYAMTAVDATTWGALPADTTDIILKQGLNMAAQTIATPAPTTSGYSINYLIEAQYQDQDTNPVVAPFYNSNNPQIPLNGQGGSGAPLPTERQGVCVVQAKAGIAATTGTQTTPSVDAGWTALAVVTVANGQSTVTSGNISVPAGVPQLTSLLQMMQTGSPAYAVDTSTSANTISIALTPAITAYTDGQEITFKAANSNTGPCTINIGGGAVNLVGATGALQGGEIVSGSQYTALYSASLNEFVLNSQTAGALQVNPATKGQHAMQLQQAQAMGSLVGAQGITAYLSTPGTVVQFAIQQVHMAASVGGARQIAGSVSPTLNIATTGAGGMDAGSSPVNATLAVYAIYNPTTQTTAVLAQSIASVPNPTYTGTNMPSGYTMSALISILSTNSSGQLVAFEQKNRKIFITRSGVFGTTTNGGTSWHQQGFSGSVPVGALTITGDYSATATASGNVIFNMAVGSDVNGLGNQTTNTTFPSGCGPSAPFVDIACDTSRNLYLYYNVTGSPTAVNFSFYASAYTF